MITTWDSEERIIRNQLCVAKMKVLSHLVGLSSDDALAVYQILQSDEELFYFSLYALRNIFEKPDPVDVILAACEIKEELENQKRPNLKHLL